MLKTVVRSSMHFLSVFRFDGTSLPRAQAKALAGGRAS
jgi:hypothetical protein